MLYLFVYLSVLSPTFLLQSRVVDAPLAPTIRAFTLCLFDVCTVIPRHGTTVYDFVQGIPRLDRSTNHATSRARSRLPDKTKGDDKRDQREIPKELPHVLPFFPAQTPRWPNVKPSSWDAPKPPRPTIKAESPKPLNDHKNRDPDLGPDIHSTSTRPSYARILTLITPTTQPQKPAAPLHHNNLHSIGAFCVTVAITLASMIVVCSLAGHVGKLQGLGMEDLPIIIKVEEGSSEVNAALQTSPSSKKAHQKTIKVELVDLNITCYNTPVPTTAPNEKAYVVPVRRVQPPRKCKMLPLNQVTSSTGTSGRKDRNSRAKRS
ncbi:hypothetical protein BDZ94DRAFT_1308384 [Collybia nuda]|uniref:Uncharacterized protein n=1 Tax=Collybia nuda TaxID=64659 RepID=A0A9P5Y9R1_9AGAR|nr:hypothetical protein BDZ94DRAFT_1308384 [Collybia nuda]